MPKKQVLIDIDILIFMRMLACYAWGMDKISDDAWKEIQDACDAVGAASEVRDRELDEGV